MDQKSERNQRSAMIRVICTTIHRQIQSTIQLDEMFLF